MITPRGGSLYAVRRNRAAAEFVIPVSGADVGRSKPESSKHLALPFDRGAIARSAGDPEEEQTLIDRCLRGDTASNVTKPAKLETGKTINVPLFIKEGEIIKIDTRTGAYMGRA